ncbi:NAD-glutamate dehydrogenase [Marinobacter sp. NP-4(2019)]|uniref:NAD-glutamate dehydrogenase n=1 Tax=Marinobacter sp. NP-4(2019) TaxID=2488665 RepID=UPI000FC3D5C8|nr:NAD-glutamate dehydrogenase [Marinobacter sp. NP-4(2019)]AZT85585.1 NAD-glutamate dehydrogenase [Marinobacter sp. NP-4(2019)]
MSDNNQKNQILNQPAISEDNWSTRLIETGGALATPYQQAFSSAYREHVAPAQAVEDIRLISELNEPDQLTSSFGQSRHPDPRRFRFRLISRADSLPLSDVVPILENLGVKVIDGYPFAVNRADGCRFWIHDFTLCATQAVELERAQPLFRDAFHRIWHNAAENDEFNRLVLMAGMDWRQVALLRAYARYIRQIRFGFSQPFIADVLCRHIDISRRLVTLFEQRFDPRQDGAASASETTRQHILDALEQVENLDEDRIIRRFLELILATLRTNYFQPAPEGNLKDYFAFKLDPSAISELPLPRPKYEVFVYSPRMEGIHLRAGKVARGGLRWSDRSEDYRTEVLGLVKAQQVKNSVIVPMGAKGCFIAKQLPTDGSREQLHAEGVACYQTYIRGLLDLADNLIDGKVVPPNAVVRYDDDDPYLVVAADKGTATFSDIANEIAAEYGFWLGDAFASGGSQGYDHKGMGITARGAWESVKRHFRERGLDSQRDAFSVIGIGDMGGDVFGNGMLLSDTLELVAAFNHQHIFVDPYPNVAAASEERRRLFALPRCNWSDYDTSLISQGGGVFSRKAKRISISPQMQARFSISADEMTPDQLISALLKAPVDMLWNGGIGTYVKGQSETHAEVGDKANDSVRVNGSELRCKVIGEGGNLGLTQHGRIEFALAGGSSNTDFIDNAGGVDCSDHEVNIKILLNGLVAHNELTLEQRNSLLRRMTDQVAELVLKNNYRQVQALSLAEQDANDALDEYIHLIDDLEASGKLDRQFEALPERKTLFERREQRKGLTRPELSVLICYAKIELKRALIDSWVTADCHFSKALESAFPALLVERYPEAVHNHQLRREIIATQIANDLINRMGITFVYNLHKATGADYAQISAAYLISCELYGIDQRWNEIEALDNQIDSNIQLAMMRELRHLISRASWWLLSRRRHDLDLQTCVASYGPGITQTLADIQPLKQAIPSRDRWQQHFQRYTEAGVPELLAAQCAASNGLYCLLDIIEAATELGRELHDVAAVYFLLGEQLNLPWLDHQIRTFKANNHWQALARNSYRDDLDAQQRTLTLSALRHHGADETPATVVESWTEKYAPFVRRWQSLLGNIQSHPVTDCAIFTVAMNVLFEPS